MLILFQPLSKASPLPKQLLPLSAQFSACAALQLSCCQSPKQGEHRHQRGTLTPPQGHPLAISGASEMQLFGSLLSSTTDYRSCFPPDLDGERRPKTFSASFCSQPSCQCTSVRYKPILEPATNSTASCSAWRKETLGPMQKGSRFGTLSSTQLDSRGHITKEVCCQK